MLRSYVVRTVVNLGNRVVREVSSSAVPVSRCLTRAGRAQHAKRLLECIKNKAPHAYTSVRCAVGARARTLTTTVDSRICCGKCSSSLKRTDFRSRNADVYVCCTAALVSPLTNAQIYSLFDTVSFNRDTFFKDVDSNVRDLVLYNVDKIEATMHIDQWSVAALEREVHSLEQSLQANDGKEKKVKK